MNPFDLRGPEFLLFYFFFSLIVILAITILRHRREAGPAPKIDLSDPYLIAYLRGGENEALRLAVLSLVNRGILVMEGQFIRRADDSAGDTVKNLVEHETLKKFSAPDKATSVFNDYNLKSALQSYRQKLEDAGLLPDAAASKARRLRFLIALMALLIVGLIKINIGLSLGRPVFLLVFMMIAAVIIAAICSFPRLTVRGKAALADIAHLYSGLRAQVNSFSPGGGPAEFAM
ncbi:MAG TPA: TIGR04222 domain-containing membrane protein, partial [Blastocatellia bacterium]